MDFVRIVNSKLSIEEISDLVSSPSCGATSLFVGTTRDSFENKQVVQLEYEAYEPMAEKAIKKLCAEIREKWKVENIAIYHRLGIVPVKEASVVIAISSPHRAESLQAVHYAIDSLKSLTPIWKKEVYASEEAEWKENKECAWRSMDLLQRIKVEPLENEEENLHLRCNKNKSSKIAEVPSHLIQINAGSEEIARRINSFIERKREQVNLGNVQDFCYHGNASLSDTTCARVDALLIRRKDSKSHLRVRRVLNPWGPQTRGIDPGSMGCTNPQDPLTTTIQNNTDDSLIYNQEDNSESKNTLSGPVALEERLNNVECHLKLSGPVPRDIYSRLKQIEDRILYLEGLSPEYFQFWNSPIQDELKDQKRTTKKRTYSTMELDSRVRDLEFKLSMKGK